MSRNLLDQETSPYLLAHKDNPVHWRAWNADALAEAQSAGKPILLSIGYTACHWCHVMNEESFSDAETAALMNDNFIPIKVDREERPDLDQIYQAAANAMGQGGGWPLTMFLTPQGEPFFAGTYFPKEARFGQPPFKSVLTEVARIYREQPEPVANATERVQQTFAQLWSRDLRGDLTPGVLDNLAVLIGQRFDMFYGGVTGAPKFPSTALVEMLWRAYLRTGVEQFNQLVQASLTNMSMGGMYDHLAGGYARYSTDDRWIVPHFEKMLYDNALIVDILLLVWQGNRARLYHDRITETLDWVLRDMRVEKAFASSIDADSEGEEGKYYVWTEAEIDAALQGTFAQRFKDVYNVTRDGNFEGKNVLHRLGRIAGYPLADADEALLARQRALLLAARQERPAPVRDDKALADWNGMMITTLANAGAVFGNRPWIDAAVAAFDFICEALGDGDRLFHSWRAGQRGPAGFADDYANMARAALALHEATGDKRFLGRARQWTHVLNEHFWDLQNGGYFTSSDEADPLIVRPRMIFDQVIPSANGVMVTVLAKLYLITTEAFYRERANGLIQAFSGEIARVGVSIPTYVNGLETVLRSLQVVIVGPARAAKTQELVAAVYGRSLPGRVVIVSEPDQDLPEGHPARGKTMENGQPTAYVCQNMTCSPPVTNAVALSQMLQMPAMPAAQAQQPVPPEAQN
jgi:uncharacterized protein YyaL (SSP411 family)